MNKKRKYLLGLTVSFVLAGCTLPLESLSGVTSEIGINSIIGHIDSASDSVIESINDSQNISSASTSQTADSVLVSSNVTSSSSTSVSSSPSSSSNVSTSLPNSNSSSLINDFNGDTCNFEGYYSSAKCLTSSQLKSKLHEIIYASHKDNISYANSDSYIADANEDPNNPNNCILFYSGKSMAKTRYNPSSSQPDAWNKEHTWAKSHGGFASALAGRDLHHLMPTYSGVNNARGNNFFDNLKNNGGTAITTFNSYKQSVTVEYSDPSDMSYKTSIAFEPRNAVKGDTARIIFYMALRYSVAGRGTSSALSLVDTETKDGPYMGKKSVLLQWHLQDPVDDFERARNEKIFGFQGNRNPFIDYPELVNMLSW